MQAQALILIFLGLHQSGEHEENVWSSPMKAHFAHEFVHVQNMAMFSPIIFLYQGFVSNSINIIFLYHMHKKK